MAKARCPFSKLDCDECRLYRSGIRLAGVEQREEKVSACVFHIIADNLEEVHKKLFTLQGEVGETKNANVFQALALLTQDPALREELRGMVEKTFGFKNQQTLAARRRTRELLDGKFEL